MNCSLHIGASRIGCAAVRLLCGIALIAALTPLQAQTRGVVPPSLSYNPTPGTPINLSLGGFGGTVTLEVAAPSPWLGLVSDVAIRLVDEGDAIFVDVRAASRYGVHDFGGNSAAITRFYAAMEAEIADRNALFQAPAE